MSGTQRCDHIIELIDAVLESVGDSGAPEHRAQTPALGDADET